MCELIERAHLLSIELDTENIRYPVTTGAITRIAHTLVKLEEEPPSAQLLLDARNLAEKLKLLHQSFKCRHDTIVDALPDDEGLDNALAREQTIYDEQDGEESCISTAIQKITQECSVATKVTPIKTLCHCLQDIESELGSVTERMMNIVRDNPSSIHIVRSYKQKISDLEISYSNTKRIAMSSCTAEEMNTLTDTLNKISTSLFDCGLDLRKLSDEIDDSRAYATMSAASASAPINVKIAKLETPKFDGEVLHWRTFWDQFKIAIREWSDVNPAQKMAYLWQSLSDGTAKGIIADLSHTGEQYYEGVKCLTEMYDQPCTIHRAHVKALINFPSMKTRSSQELTKVHENFMQHW